MSKKDFNRDEYYEYRNSIKKVKETKPRKKGLIVGCILGGIVLTAVVIGLVVFNNLKSNTQALFNMPTSAPVTEVSVPNEEQVAATAVPVDSSAYNELQAEADASIADSEDILNILLIGIDYSDERITKQWLENDGSTSEHADVMLNLAINFKTQTVDMISLPRDTYTKIPDVQGIYKLNASLDCGGGLFQKDEEGNYILNDEGKPIITEEDDGLMKVCESCSWLLGGTPINYYYAVTMPAVKELVNAIGGVDYNLDIDFDMMGRSYKAGQQHMDGQAVLDYLRVRKSENISNATEEQVGDTGRVSRQKEMLVAILNQLKSTNTLLKIPEILSGFEGQLFTNCDASQTASLALYAFDMPSENIRMRSMKGEWGESAKCANQHFFFLNPDARVELIKEVFGVDVPKELEITKIYGYYLWASLTAKRYKDATGPLCKDSAAKSAFRPVYTKMKSLMNSADESAAIYLVDESEGPHLSSITTDLRQACEDVKDTAGSVDKDNPYRMDFSVQRILNDYNEIKVDPS